MSQQTDIYDQLPGVEGRPTLKIGEAAAELGVARGTLRGWCERGVVRFARTPGGQRRFSRGELERVRRAMWDLGGGVTAIERPEGES